MTSEQWSLEQSTDCSSRMLCDARTKLRFNTSGSRCSMLGTFASGSSVLSFFALLKTTSGLVNFSSTRPNLTSQRMSTSLTLCRSVSAMSFQDLQNATISFSQSSQKPRSVSHISSRSCASLASSMIARGTTGRRSR